MLRLIKFLFTGDWHLCKYQTDKHIFSSSTGYLVYSCRCETCGKIKFFSN